jgi:GntR family transcriptional regulator/MocR family aminotransferase
LWQIERPLLLMAAPPVLLMPKQPANVILDISVKTSTGVPLHRQVYFAVKALILNGRLRPGDRLPSTRLLAKDLGLSRTTVLNAVDQLTLEGYVEGKVGSGTRVSSRIPADLRELAGPGRKTSSAPEPRTSQRARKFPTIAPPALRTSARPLRPGYPAVELFPLKLWARLTAKHWRLAVKRFGDHGDSSGYRPLREAVCEYVWRMRAVRCAADQVLIVAGAQHALSLCAHALLDPGESVWMEDPGYPRARIAFAAAGLRPIPVPVDSEGLNVEAGSKKDPDARLIYATPSFQCPLGSMMSLPRRFELLRHASEKSAWVVEDDYFSEYRYGADPVASLQSLDRNDRVIYIGNFSKTIVPFLRIGFVIVPPALVDVFKRARVATSRQPPGVDQAALAEFISEGYLQRHIRTTVQLYGERHEALVQAIGRQASGLLETTPAGTGLYLVASLPPGVDDRDAVKAVAAENVDAVALSTFSVRHLRRGGLVLGYSGYPVDQIRWAVDQLCVGLRRLVRRRH